MRNLSKAIEIFLQWGESSFPKENKARVSEIFGPSEGLELLACIEVILRKLNEIEPDWSVDNLESAARKAVTTVRQAFPELDDNACLALEWAYTWWWK